MQDAPWIDGFAEEDPLPDAFPSSEGGRVDAGLGDSLEADGSAVRLQEAGIPGVSPPNDGARSPNISPADPVPVPAEEPYIVTRGKPPRETQFKKGQSGNPKGRPRGSREMGTLLEQELDRTIEVTQQGRTIKLTRRQVIVRRIIEKAMQGDPKAIATCLSIESSKAAKGKAAGATAAEFDVQLSEDDKILLSYLERNGGGDHD